MAVSGSRMDFRFRSVVTQLWYWNGRLRHTDGFSFPGITTLVLELLSPAAGFFWEVLQGLEGPCAVVARHPKPASLLKVAGGSERFAGRPWEAPQPFFQFSGARPLNPEAGRFSCVDGRLGRLVLGWDVF